jgi:hypothetical protein
MNFNGNSSFPSPASRIGRSLIHHTMARVAGQAFGPINERVLDQGSPGWLPGLFVLFSPGLLLPGLP